MESNIQPERGAVERSGDPESAEGMHTPREPPGLDHIWHHGEFQEVSGEGSEGARADPAGEGPIQGPGGGAMSRPTFDGTPDEGTRVAVQAIYDRTPSEWEAVDANLETYPVERAGGEEGEYCGVLTEGELHRHGGQAGT